MARRVNQAHGGVIVAAWQVDDLPQDWLEAMAGIVDDLPNMKDQMQAFERNRERWRDGLIGPDGTKGGERRK